MRKELTYATVCSGVECFSAAVPDLPLKPVFFAEIEPYPCAVLKARYPHVPNLGDMSQIHCDGKTISNGKTDIPYSGLDIFAGGTPCFCAGTMVLTEDGYKPIEKLKVGDRVLTHKHRLRKIVRTGKKMADGIVKAQFASRPAMRCTDYHPFPLLKASHSHDNHIVFKSESVKTQIKDGKGKYGLTIDVAKVEGISAPKFPKVYDCDDKQIAELIGWYLGDGYIRKVKGKTKKGIVFCLNEKKYKQFIETFGTNIHFFASTSRTAIKVCVSCTAFADFLLKHFGEHAHAKRIPTWAYTMPGELREAMLHGYWLTDGNAMANGRRWTTTSPALAFGIADIAGNTCVSFYKRSPTCVIEGRTVNQRSSYTMTQSFSPNRFHSTSEGYAVRCREVNYTNTKDVVYNIEVEEDHTYVANGIISYNCQDVSNAGKKRGMEEGSGTRSSLAFEYVRLIRELKPRYVVWENVCGCLSDESFPKFLCKIAECGYSLTYRVLDAQYTMCSDIHHKDGRMVSLGRAVPQRRRRVWVVGVRTVGCTGIDFGRFAEVLFEPEGVRGDTPPRRITREEIARLAAGRAGVSDSAMGRWGVRGCGCGCGRGDGRVIAALDGDKLKPRLDQRKGGNGFGVSEANVGYTLTTVDRHGVATEEVHKCCSTGKNVASTLSADDGTYSGQDFRSNSVVEHRVFRCDSMASNSMKSANPNSVFHETAVSGCLDTTTPEPSKNQGGDVLVSTFAKTSHARGADGEGERWEQSAVAGTRNCFDNGDGRAQEAVVTTYENHAQDARVREAEVCPTMGASNANSMGVSGNNPLLVTCFDNQTRARNPASVGNSAPCIQAALGTGGNNSPLVVATNSNGENVAPTCSACDYKGVQKQKETGGGYVIEQRILQCAQRARDHILAVEQPPKTTPPPNGDDSAELHNERTRGRGGCADNGFVHPQGGTAGGAGSTPPPPPQAVDIKQIKVNPQMHNNLCHTITATAYKEPPAVVMQGGQE